MGRRIRRTKKGGFAIAPIAAAVSTVFPALANIASNAISGLTKRKLRGSGRGGGVYKSGGVYKGGKKFPLRFRGRYKLYV